MNRKSPLTHQPHSHSPRSAKQILKRILSTNGHIKNLESVKSYGYKNANEKKTLNKIYSFSLTWKVEHEDGFFVC